MRPQRRNAAHLVLTDTLELFLPLNSSVIRLRRIAECISVHSLNGQRRSDQSNLHPSLPEFVPPNDYDSM